MFLILDVEMVFWNENFQFIILYKISFFNYYVLIEMTNYLNFTNMMKIIIIVITIALFIH